MSWRNDLISPQLNAMRLIQVANGGIPDAVPVLLPVESGFMAEYGNVPQREYHNDPRKMLECQAAVSKRFGGLTPLYTDFGVVTEAAAFCEIFWPEDDSPWALPAIKTADEVDSLSIPNFEKDGLFPKIIEYFEKMNDLANEIKIESLIRNSRGPVGFGTIRGPVVLAAMIRGINEFFMDLILAPEQMHRLLNIATETLLGYLKLQKERLGGLSVIFMADDVSGLISPAQYKEFFIPYARRIFDEYKDVLTIYHCDSNMAKTVELAAETGAKGFHMGYMHDLADLKKSIGTKIGLMGNVAPVHVLMRGTPEDVTAAATECIRKASEGGGFVLSSGGVIDRGTPPENIDALIAATEYS